VCQAALPGVKGYQRWAGYLDLHTAWAFLYVELSTQPPGGAKPGEI
jgi:hypothetical protein